MLDDVLNNRSQFKAMQTLLGHRYPGVPITGIVIARMVFAGQPDPSA